MNRLIRSLLITLFLLASGLGLSMLTVTPLLPNLYNECVNERALNYTGAGDTSFTDDTTDIYNKCSILPQSVSIIATGIGVALSLILFRLLKIVTLKNSGIFLMALLYIALEIAFYVLFQYKHFLEAQAAFSAKQIAENYLFGLASLGSLGISLALIPRLLKQKLFTTE